MMRVLAVTLGRSLRPRHNDQDNQHSSPAHHIKKDDASHKLLISSKEREKQSAKACQRDSRNGKSNIPRNSNLKHNTQSSSIKSTPDREKKSSDVASTFSSDGRDSTRSTKSLIPTKGGRGSCKPAMHGKRTEGIVRSANKTTDFETTKIIVPSQGNETKSARVARIPKDSMSNHRTKLVRNSSLSKLRAKFRRQPPNCEVTPETDTEQLLDDSEEHEKLCQANDFRNVLMSHKAKEADVIRFRPEPSSSSTYSSGSSCKNSNYGSVTQHQNQKVYCEPKNKNNLSIFSNEVNERVSKINKDEGSWSAIPPPPRCLTPHRVHLPGDLIPWVDPVRRRDQEAPYYLPMGGRPGYLSSNNNTKSPTVYGSPSSLPYMKTPVNSMCPSSTRPDTNVGSWPRPSRVNGIEPGGKRESGTHQVHSGTRNVLQGNHSNGHNSLQRNHNLNTTSVSLGSYPSNTNVIGSQFGTFPRRRPVQKASK